MLWYKAWLETRLRFLICLVGITALCVYDVMQDTRITSPANMIYYFSIQHNTANQLAIFWLLAANLTTMGGLLREKAAGAASFTLALPFSRARLAGVRAAAALAEAMTMLVVPWIAVLIVTNVLGKASSLQQWLFQLLLLVCGGMVYLGLALLASSLFEGEYIAPLVSLGFAVLIASVFDGADFRAYSPIAFMMGADQYHANEGLLVGPVPWAQIAVYSVISICLVMGSVGASGKRDF